MDPIVYLFSSVWAFRPFRPPGLPVAVPVAVLQGGVASRSTHLGHSYFRNRLHRSRWLVRQPNSTSLRFRAAESLLLMRFAFYDARLRLAFLPVVGHWFMPKDDKQEDDDDEADNLR